MVMLDETDRCLTASSKLHNAADICEGRSSACDSQWKWSSDSRCCQWLPTWSVSVHRPAHSQSHSTAEAG